MSPLRCFTTFSALTLAAALLAGCGHGDHDHDNAGAHGHSHGDDAGSFSGATHKEGEGITLLAETRQRLGIQTVEVGERRLPREVRFTGRVVDAAVGGVAPAGLLAVGAVSTNDAVMLRAGRPARFVTRSGAALGGEVHRLTRPLANDDAEVIVALGGDTSALRPGEFGEVVVTVPGGKEVLTVPQEAVIRGAMGDLVYVVNGDAYLLTWVELGAASDGFVEIADGLLAGDRVVTRGAMDLWLIELRAQKGGQGCCPAPPKKEKK
jgi:multidrug efflux pump subunit AcrA (membrane-fusion protein)